MTTTETKPTLESKDGVVQATKFDGNKPQIFLIPARGWFAMTTAKHEMQSYATPEGESPELRFMKFFTRFKTGEDYSALAVAGVILMRALGDQSRTDWWVNAKHKVTRVFEYGAKKYKVGNWHAGDGFTWSRLIRAAEGHADSHFAGEVIDPESGLEHLAHALCCILMLLEHHLTGFGSDDRSEYQHIPDAIPVSTLLHGVDTTNDKQSSCDHDNGHKND